MTTQEAFRAPTLAPGTATAAATRRPSATGLTIAVIAGAQLMIALDVTIVNIALPHIAAALHFSRASLTWVIDAYTLVFGGLMLAGGRAADFLGRRRMFIIGLALFSAASLVGGLATTSALLIAARSAQGIGAAIASPTALSLVVALFAEGGPRNRALAAYAAATAGGGVLGLIAGGFLTDLLSWRWVLFVNVIIGALLIVAAVSVIPPIPRGTVRPGVPGALLSVLGIGGLVFGLLHAAAYGWRDPVTVGAFCVAALVVAGFILVQNRSKVPLLPLRLFRNRNRVGSYVMGICIGASIFSAFFFLTQFVQEILGYSPIRAGIAFLPLMVMLGVTAQAAGRLLARTGPKPLLITGSVLVLAALGWLTRLTAGSSYLSGVLPALLVLGLGLGSFFVPLAGTAVAGVRDAEAGVASAAYNMFFQVGGAVGIAALTTVFTSAFTSALHAHRMPQGPVLVHALAHGWATAFGAAAGFALLALVVAIAVIRVRPGEIDPAHVH